MRCLDVVTELMGFHLDALKSANDLLEMTVLGEMVSILMASRQVSVRVAKEKAEKWTRELDEILHEGVCVRHTRHLSLLDGLLTQWARLPTELGKPSSGHGMPRQRLQWQEEQFHHGYCSQYLSSRST